MVDICYYSSDFYAPYTGVSMYSLCKNNADLDFRLNCIDTGISEENKNKMREVANRFHRGLLFHDFSKLESFIRDELNLPICNGSYATYIKVFPDKIFQNADRILFMDGDTIINGSIKAIFEADLDPYVFAATKVSLINERHVYADEPKSLRLQYSLLFHGTGYYNIGVFYANLKRWKEVDFGDQIMKMRDLHLASMSQANDVPIDEMLINLAALAHLDEHYVLPLPAIYNSTAHNIPHYRAWKANRCCGYLDKKSFDEAYYHPVIIHYCIFKPWFIDTFSPHRKIMKKYIAESPWPDAFTDTMYKTIPEKFFGKLIYRMPSESLMVFGIRCGHLFLRMRGFVKNCFSRIRRRDVRMPKKGGNPDSMQGSKNPYTPRTHAGSAFCRRYKLLIDGDWRGAFAWPKKYIENRRNPQR